MYFTLDKIAVVIAYHHNHYFISVIIIKNITEKANTFVCATDLENCPPKLCSLDKHSNNLLHLK